MSFLDPIISHYIEIDEHLCTSTSTQLRRIALSYNLRCASRLRCYEHFDLIGRRHPADFSFRRCSLIVEPHTVPFPFLLLRRCRFALAMPVGLRFSRNQPAKADLHVAWS